MKNTILHSNASKTKCLHKSKFEGKAKLFSTILLAFLFGININLCYSQISRTKIISNAESYVNFSWTANSCNLWSGEYCGNRYVYAATPANSTQRGWVKVGTNTSMPYAWGGYSSKEQHISAMSSCKSAGDICSAGTVGGNCKTQGGAGAGLSCASGLDCSGLITKAWEMPQAHLGTGELPSYSTIIPISQMQPGDIFNDVGVHTMLFKSKNPDGSITVIETSGRDWKTTTRTVYNLTELSTYNSRCPKSDIVIGGCGGVTTPTNDNPCDAGVPTLPVGTSCSFTQGTNVGATNSNVPILTNCDGTSNGDVWFKFQVPSSGSVIIETDAVNLTNEDMGMALYTGSNCNSLSYYGCYPNGSSYSQYMPRAELTGLSPNSTMWIRMWEYNNNNFGTFKICVTDPSPSSTPPNDNPCDAGVPTLTVGTSCSFTQGTNVGATNSGVPNISCDGTSNGDVWFKFQVPSSGSVIIETDAVNLTNEDMGMALYTGSNCNSLSYYNCYPNGSSYSQYMPRAEITGLTPNATMWIRMWEYNNNNFGTFSICVTGSSSTTKPDLIVQNPQISPSTVVMGQQVTATCYIKNQGTGNASSSYTALWFSADLNFDGTPTDINLNADIYVPALNANETSSLLSKQFNIPMGPYAGTWYIMFGADAINTNPNESNENNNQIFIPITFQSTLTVSPSSLSLGAASGSNDQISVSSNVSWSASDNASWLSVSPSNGSNNGTVTVTAASENTSTNSRSATVTISGNGITRNVSVTQNGAASTLTVSPSSLSLGAASGSNDQISVSSNVSWSASDNASWLSVSPSNGSNNGTVTVTATSENTSTNSRSATVTISGNGITRNVSVTQNGAASTLTVSPSSLSLGAASGSNDQISVSSNVSWSASDNASWLSVSPSNGSNNGTVTVTATSENTSTNSRSATVTISGNGITRNVSVTQNGAAASLTVSPSSLSLGAASGSNDQISVSSNVSWSASDNASWLSVSPSNGSNNGTVTVTATSENTSTNSRSATVTISGNGITRNVSVTQNGAASTLTVSPSSLSLGAASGSNDQISVSSNVSWSASDNASWLSVSPSNGSNNGTVTVTATSENTSTNSRSATVTISGNGITRNVSVTQNGAAASLTVSPSSLSLGAASGSNDQISVSSNVSWSASDNASWLSVSPSNGSNNGTVTVTATSENTSTNSRSATVTISGNGITRNVSVTQNGAAASLTVSPSSLSLGAASGSNDQISVSSNVSWSASDNASWLSVSPSNGSNNGTVTVTATSENTSTNSRSATVTISGNGITRNVSVTQNGAASTLTVSPSSLSLGAASGSNDQISVSSNVSWSARDNASWLSVSPSNGSNNGTVTVTATSENTSTNSRSGTVTISGNGITRNVSITQNGAASTLTVSPSSLSLGSASGSNDQISVSSNVSWSASENASWLSVSPSNGANNGTVTVTATSENTSTNSRSATVTISGNGITRNVSVTQNGAASTLTVSPSSLTLGAASGNNDQISVSSNVNWSASDNASWLSVSPSNGSNNGTATVTTTSENTSTSSRSATVTISGNGITRNVSVTQNGITTSSYCSAGSSSIDEYISNVTCGSINQSSEMGYGGYQDFSSQNTTVRRGENLSVTITLGKGYTSDQILIWIDWNEDGDFTDTGESVYATIGILEYLTNTASFIVPAGVTLGTKRMRIRLHDTANGPNANPCGNSQWGEVEDYSVNVIEACTPPSVQATSFTSSATTNNSMTIGWSRGNGNAVLVIARTGNNEMVDPINGTSYIANSGFGNGTQIGIGNYVVYEGTGTSINLTSLSEGTSYYFAIYEYNTSSNCYLLPALIGNANTTGNTINSCDTLTNILSSDNLTSYYWESPNWGYLPGHNSYNFAEYAEHFTDITNKYFTGLEVLISNANSGGNGGNHKVTFMLYESDNGIPGTILGSQDISIESLTPFTLNYVPFDQPIMITESDVYVGFQIYYNTPADTFNVTVAESRTNFTNSAYVKENSTWNSFPTIFGISSAMCIYPSFCSNQTTPVTILENNLKYLKVYPNPTTGMLTIEGLPNQEKSEIAIYHVIGGLIKKQDSFSSIAQMDISNVVSGTYLLVINNRFDQAIKIIKR